MSFTAHESCELCDKIIREDEKVVKIRTGLSRPKSHILRLIGSLFRSSYQGTIVYAHATCIDKDVTYGYPTDWQVEISQYILRGKK